MSIHISNPKVKKVIGKEEKQLVPRFLLNRGVNGLKCTEVVKTIEKECVKYEKYH